MNATDLAAQLSLSRRPGQAAWSGDCPACAYPRAFSLKAGRDGRALLWCANGCTFEQLRDAVGGTPSAASAPATRPSPDRCPDRRPDRRDAAMRLWNATVPCPGTAAAAYLSFRGLPWLAHCQALRFRPDCPHPGGAQLAALVALVQDGAGRPLGVHRTYLTAAGAKAGVDPARASLGPIWGGAVRLHPAAPHIVLGEGIETAGSAGAVLGLPAWAALSAGNLGRGVWLPPEVRAVTIAVDPDPPGLAAAQQAGDRFEAEGRAVGFAVPSGTDDFNAVLLHAQSLEATHA